MDYAVTAKPDPTPAAVRALLLFGIYLITKHRSRSAKDTRDAMTWIKKSVDDTYATVGGADLDWIPMTASGEVKQFFHLSTTDTDRVKLFNLYRDAVLKYVAEWGVHIDDDIVPLFLALEPGLSADFDTPELRRRYGLSHDIYFDRTFITETFEIAGALRRMRADAFARAFLGKVDGMWLMYRFSSKGFGDTVPIERLEQTRTNVSLVRIRPFAHLSPFETTTPVFIYESTSDIPQEPTMRVHGHLYPAGGRVNFLGQRVRSEESQLGPVAFSWPLPPEGIAPNAQRMTRCSGVAYGMNSTAERVAFYFLALFVPNAGDEATVVYDEKVKVYKELVGVYSTTSLDSELQRELATARKRYESDLSDPRKNPLAGLELPVPVPTQDELNELFKRSREDIVFKRR